MSGPEPPRVMSAAGVLSHEGAIARVLGGVYEARPEQIEMARAVESALADRAALLVEAGTGVGKSFAYLVPAIARIIQSGGAERVVVATNTIALQEQLMRKDVPLLARALAQSDGAAPPFRAELVKGRGNYLSIRRLKLASERQEKLLVDEPSRRSLHVIEEWAYGTSDGTLSSLPPLERPGVWDRAQSDSGNCMGRRCPTYEQCFYQNARKRMMDAHLLICNHALFFSDLALRQRGVGFLPAYDHVILDEAHGVEDVASEHFGVQLSEGRVRHLLASLFSSKGSRGPKGFLASLRTGAEGGALVDGAARLCEGASAATDEFFAQLAERLGGGAGTVRLEGPGQLEDPLSPVFRELALALKRLGSAIPFDEDRFELSAYAQRASEIAGAAELLVTQSMPACAYWAEATLSESYGLRLTLACSPIEVGPLLNEALFAQGCSVVLTSATLATGGGSFDHATRRLGCPDARTLLLGSPFDHSGQVTLYAEASMPDPRAPGHEQALSQRILHHTRATDGGAFVLFTSFKTMHRVAELLAPALEALRLPMLVQGRDGSRSAILDTFRANERSVLLGTSSFWQGVDVPGRGLRNVIITRLPFDPPDRPLTQARLALIEARGGDPFFEDSLPRAILRFKQGFGRLIRSSSDEGRVVVLDPRLLTKGYGRQFIAALPAGVGVRSEDDDVIGETGSADEG